MLECMDLNGYVSLEVEIEKQFKAVDVWSSVEGEGVGTIWFEEFLVLGSRGVAGRMYKGLKFQN